MQVSQLTVKLNKWMQYVAWAQTRFVEQARLTFKTSTGTVRIAKRGQRRRKAVRLVAKIPETNLSSYPQQFIENRASKWGLCLI